MRTYLTTPPCMDEEGTVVYFETSPALEGQGEQFSTEFSFPKEEVECFKKEHSNLIPAPQSANIWKKLITINKIFIPDLSHKENDCRHGIAKVIKDSPLLTEEDYQLLYFILLKPHPQEGVTHNRPRISTSTKSILGVVLVVLLAVCVTQFTRTTVLMWTASATMLLCSRSAITHLLCITHESTLESARKAVNDYCTKTESLLTLLSHCLRTIQEVEMISRRYNKPSQGVPACREEGSTVCYQCVGLRHRLFSACQNILDRLRNTTLTVCQQYPLRIELGDDVASCLAQSSLDSLHSHITTDLDTVSREGMRRHKCLSLESLKDAANLLAVQNSELLRFLALALLDGPGRAVTGLPLHRLPGMLKEVEDVVSEARQGLEWSRDLHWNHLFGRPPSRPSTAMGNRASSPLADLAREILGMDLKTQAALQRIRNLGSQLATVCDGDEQLTATQCIIDAVSDHIEDGLSIIHSLEHQEDTHKDAVGDEGHIEDEVADVKESNIQPVPVESRSQDSCSSEDEMVFEAYVPALMADKENGGTDSSWKVEGGEREREVSAKMVRELEDVLAVRSEKRDRQREERRLRRRKRTVLGKTEEDKENSDLRSTTPVEEDGFKIRGSTLSTDEGPGTANDVTLPSSVEQEDMELPNIQSVSEKHTLTSVKLGRSDSDQVHISESHDTPTPALGVFQVAARVAAIAVGRRGPMQTEETYGSDSSHSE